MTVRTTKLWRGWTFGGMCLAGLAILLSPAMFSSAQEGQPDEPRASRSSSQGSGSASGSSTAGRMQEMERKIARLERIIDEQNKRLDELAQNDPTRVAVINLPKVIKEYKKTAAQENELKDLAKKYESTLKSLSEKLQSIRDNLPQDEEKKEAAQEQMRRLERELADCTAERNGALQRKGNEAVKTLYRDIEAASATVARAHHFDLVFFYSDAADPNARYSPEVLRLKVGSSGLPIYTGPGLDFTEDVVKALNKGYEPAEATLDSDR